MSACTRAGAKRQLTGSEDVVLGRGFIEILGKGWTIGGIKLV